MTGERLARLTEKEREALRLVPTHGTIVAIADALGISDSAVKLRLASAAKKLGVVGRHDAARLLMEEEGWPYPNRTAPIGQVEPRADLPPAGDHQAPGDGAREAADGSIDEPTLGHLVVQIADRLARRGGRNRLTIGQRIAVIFVVTILGLLLFAMVLATITETGRFGRSLKTTDRTSI